MKKLSFEEIWQSINCLVPIYDEHGGNVTEVHLDDGRVLIDQRKTCSVVNSLAKVFAVSVGGARKKYSKLVNRKLSVPIPLHQDLVLVPVKMRKPIAREDGAWGYVVLSKITCYDSQPEQDDQVEIFFDNQLSIPIILQTKSFQLILESARIIHREYKELHESRGKNLDKDRVNEEPIRYILTPYVPR